MKEMMIMIEMMDRSQGTPERVGKRDGPLVSYRTRSGWPYNRSNELIGRRDRHASCAFVLFRYRFKLGKSAKYSLGSFEFSISRYSSLPLWLFGELEIGSIHLGRIINNSMYDATIGKRDQRLAFPVLITRMAIAYNVPTYPEDNIMIVEEKDKYCPFGNWQQEKRKARKGDLPRTSSPPIPPPIHEAENHPSTSAAAANQPPAAQSAAQPPMVDASCTDIFKKILRRLHRRKQDHRNTQYMIRTAFPEVEFPDVRTVSTSDSDDADYS
ncbi:hypothetical protein PIB30_033424 [Stylosanthes scabra]|uniref:Uncharacterized protein n=1 Tax=Stylosanthes scabra TaxID=79078 RepID=A0ABU6SC80_9FABA|nr:hypothetical protein [Stylosanthes scabra]